MKKGSFEIIKRMLVFVRPYASGLALVILLGGCGSFLNVLIPGRVEKLSGVIEAGIGTQIDFSAVRRLGLLLAVIIIAMFLCNYLYGRGMESYAQKVSADIRTTLNSKINRISLLKMDQLTAGGLIANMTSDVYSISIAFSRSIGPLVTNAIVLVGTVIAMFMKSVPMAVCVTVTTLSGVIISMVISSKMIPKRNALREEQSHINGIVDETLKGFMVIRSYNSEDDVLEQFKGANERYYTNLKKTQFISSELTPVMAVLNNLSYVAVCIVGTWLIVSGSKSVTIGVIIAFLLYQKMLSSPLSFFSEIISMLAFTMVNCGKILNVLDMPENLDEGTKQISGEPGAVTFRDVHFGYTKDQEIIHGFSAEIKPGMKVAIVGHTGAGKTTLVNLLTRFYEVDSGEILIDGTNIKDIPRERLHQILGMVMQETFLFGASIRDNILYYAPEASEEDLMDTIEKCSLRHYIETLPDGLDTVLSEKVSASSGQRQLISIARTMIKKPSILILDEATSCVDTRTEMMIQRALDELSKDHTSFVIAHRLSTVRNADVIFVMKDGDIAETGTHEQLLAQNGIYTRLYKSQFEYTEEECAADKGEKNNE